jgi:hypothetical protein
MMTMSSALSALKNLIFPTRTLSHALAVIRSASFATTTSRPIAKRADAPTAGAFMMKALYNTRFLMQTSTYYIFAFWQHFLRFAQISISWR